MASIIRKVMTEFGAVGDNYSISDPEVDTMYEAYQLPRCAYFVVEKEGRVIGGAGVAPLKDANETVCELQKMYLLSESRGLGAGKALVTQCFDVARKLKFKQIYSETLTHMHQAQKLYEQNGFTVIDEPLGNTGHSGCDQFYVRDL